MFQYENSQNLDNKLPSIDNYHQKEYVAKEHQELEEL